jgi:hypothetical protein
MSRSAFRRFRHSPRACARERDIEQFAHPGACCKAVRHGPADPFKSSAGAHGKRDDRQVARVAGRLGANCRDRGKAGGRRWRWPRNTPSRIVIPQMAGRIRG